MAKKDRFPDAYSSGFPPNDESEGSGCSGRDHMDENSSGVRKKWIKLSSAFHDGFGVPIRSVPLSTLPSSEKQKWLIRLRSELDHIRKFQKRVEVDKNHVTVSSNNIVSHKNVQETETNLRKSMDLQAQKTRKMNENVTGRFHSLNEPAVPEAFSLILRKQCENLLKKLMTHQHGWVFNKPVDVVALKIPDYFNVIKKPMDLGTVKEKLGSGSYSNPFQFVADVRLTFANAMTYNPPGNDVHIMADIVSKFFELRWKPIEKKLSVNCSQQKPIHEVVDLVKPIPIPPSKKRKMSLMEPNELSDSVKLVMKNDEKEKLSRELEANIADLPDSFMEFLRQHSSNTNENGEDEIEIDLDKLNDETLFELRKRLDDHIRKKQNDAKAEPCVIELLNESGLSNSTMQLYKGNDLADEDIDIGGNEPQVSSKKNKKESTSDSDSDSENGHSENELKDVKASSSFIGEKENDVTGTDLVHKTGDSAANERRVSPDKLYRAAVLKNRFADTIFKAREKTLLNQADPEKLRREKEQLENQKRKEKARLQAEAKAAEASRRRVEEEAAAEAKRKRDLEREAARQALLKMEKTVEIDETSRFLKDLEMLRGADPTEPSGLDELMNEHEDGFMFGASNPLEQLGLYMKRDEHEEDDNDEEDETDAHVHDVEEGEIN